MITNEIGFNVSYDLFTEIDNLFRQAKLNNYGYYIYYKCYFDDFVAIYHYPKFSSHKIEFFNAGFNFEETGVVPTDTLVIKHILATSNNVVKLKIPLVIEDENKYTKRLNLGYNDKEFESDHIQLSTLKLSYIDKLLYELKFYLLKSETAQKNPLLYIGENAKL